MSRLLAVAAVVAASFAVAAPSSAVVGGRDAAPGAYPAVAEIRFGSSFLCTGTLIAPRWVLTAGHCSSITGVAVASPAAWPPQLIDVRIGSVTPGAGERVPVRRVIVNPDSFFARPSPTRQRILAHELLHIATRPHAGPFTPAWVEEGVAQRLGEGPPPGGFALVAAEVARGGGGELPLDAEFTTGGRERVLLSYQLSYSLFTHLTDTYGEDAVAEFYGELGRGAVGEPGRRAHHLDRAARSAFGATVDELRADWERSLTGG
jgi:hypothetical protein